MNNADPGILVMLVGNKADMESERVVSTEEGKSRFNPSLYKVRLRVFGCLWTDFVVFIGFAQEHNLSFIETSAKTGHNTDKAFELTIQGKWHE
jgi:GTPase SAR1 family protein